MSYPGDDDKFDPVEGENIVETDEEWDVEEQLALADEDEALPWLEGDDYEDEPGFDWRLVVYALVGLLVVGALLAATWWLTRDKSDPDLLPEGSTIEAPDGAYKERPDDPGGAEVEGTGGQAFEVAEGQSTRGIIADDAANTPAPAIDREQGSDQGRAAATGEQVYVQIGAFGSRADAETEWSRASQRYGTLSGMRHRIVEGDLNGARIYRLQVIAANREAGEATCRSIRNAGGDCYIR